MKQNHRYKASRTLALLLAFVIGFTLLPLLSGSASAATVKSLTTSAINTVCRIMFSMFSPLTV